MSKPKRLILKLTNSKLPDFTIEETFRLAFRIPEIRQIEGSCLVLTTHGGNTGEILINDHSKINQKKEHHSADPSTVWSKIREKLPDVDSMGSYVFLCCNSDLVAQSLSAHIKSKNPAEIYFFKPDSYKVNDKGKISWYKCSVGIKDWRKLDELAKVYGNNIPSKYYDLLYGVDVCLYHSDVKPIIENGMEVKKVNDICLGSGRGVMGALTPELKDCRRLEEEMKSKEVNFEEFHSWEHLDIQFTDLQS